MSSGLLVDILTDGLISDRIYHYLDRWSLHCLGSVSREMHAKRLGRELQLPDGRIWASEWKDVSELESVPFSAAIGDLVVQCKPSIPFRLIVKFGPFLHLNIECPDPDRWVHIPLFQEPLHREQIRYVKFEIKWTDNIRIRFELLTPVNFCCRPSLSLQHKTTVGVFGNRTLEMAKGKIL